MQAPYALDTMTSTLSALQIARAAWQHGIINQTFIDTTPEQHLLVQARQQLSTALNATLDSEPQPCEPVRFRGPAVWRQHATFMAAELLLAAMVWQRRIHFRVRA